MSPYHLTVNLFLQTLENTAFQPKLLVRRLGVPGIQMPARSRRRNSLPYRYPPIASQSKPDGSGSYLWYLDYLGTMQRIRGVPLR